LRHTLLFILSFTFLYLAPVQALSKEKSLKSSKVKTKKKKKSTQKRLGIDQSDFMPSAREFGFIFSYSFDYNSLQNVSPHQINHYLGVSATYSIDKNFSSFMSMSVRHTSENLNVIRRGPEDNFHEISNLNLGAVYSHLKNGPWLARNAVTLSASFPLSERSRVNMEFIRLNLSHYIQSKPWNRISFYNRIRGNLLANRSRFSIWDNDGFSGGTLNRDWLIQNSAGANVSITDRIGLRSSLTLNNTHFLDGSWDFSFGNQVSVFANYFGVQFYLQMFNQSYPENEGLQLIYYDQYRRFFAGGLTYAF